MLERYYPINKDERNCEGCDLLREWVANIRRCELQNRPIYQIESCRTGKMVALPTNPTSLDLLSSKVRGLFPEQFSTLSIDNGKI